MQSCSVRDAAVVQKELKTVAAYGIYHDGKAVTQNGYHVLTEVEQGGKTYIYDNLNQGILKSNYVKTLEVAHDGKLYTGEAAYDLFQSKK